MDLVYVGKIVNTHGIKGELRIKSDFEKKELVFKVGNKIIIDSEEHIIRSYRYHKIFDMITIDDFNNINDVLKYVGKNVYVSRSSLALNSDDYLLSDLIGLNVVFNNISYGVVSDYSNSVNPLLKIEYEKNYYIPINSSYIKSVDLANKKIIVDNIEGLII
ncbi:MAG: 16S rRNA processing protein RimM [Bacilli bacterium]|nr:16S rRNA processing protein RimM [Bacilli bacterium]